MGKTAILLGASGLTGKLLLKQLLEDSTYEQVKIFTRRALGIQHAKIVEYVVDLLQLHKHISDFTADEVFCCIGTTANKTKDKAVYKKIDFGIPVAAAKLCKANKIETFIVISALGANAESRIFYNRTKGEMELFVERQKIMNTYILRPSLIDGKRREYRVGERIAAAMMKILDPLLFGSLKKYRAIEAEIIASCMHFLAQSKPNYIVVESDEIQELGTSN
ncbi:NAD(P)H-binding protein [Labilibaculum sp.]|uniref:NAD(P)H-binding protein n=1 Tax=Labilibaculum sp. TaxID=2060723 RepID=UPI003561A6EF